MTAWHASGQYYETCSCDFRLSLRAGTDGSQSDQRILHVCDGRSRSSAGITAPSPLDGLGFIVLGWTPEAMGKGNWSVGVIADERGQRRAA